MRRAHGRLAVDAWGTNMGLLAAWAYCFSVLRRSQRHLDVTGKQAGVFLGVPTKNETAYGKKTSAIRTWTQQEGSRHGTNWRAGEAWC